MQNLLLKRAHHLNPKSDLSPLSSRGQDTGREHPSSLQPCPHRHHRPGPEPQRRWQPGLSPPACRAARQEDQTPGGPGGRDEAGLGAVGGSVGHHRLRSGPDQRADELEEERRSCREPATAGEHQHSVHGASGAAGAVICTQSTQAERVLHKTASKPNCDATGTAVRRWTRVRFWKAQLD